jgi:phosphoribosylformylglycinamidine synthase PurS subunit
MVSRARVFVTLKNGVLDPQGDAVSQALASLGFAGIQDVRVGKVIEIGFDETSPDEARQRLTLMASKLFANPVIENHRIELLEGARERP